VEAVEVDADVNVYVDVDEQVPRHDEYGLGGHHS
jgi:hypothetical protein